MKKLDLFSCPLWIGECELDRPKLGAAIMEFKELQMNNLASNIGGYQGIDFDKFYPDFSKNVIMSMPTKIMGEELIVKSWINLNYKGNFNIKHQHFNQSIILSGVYYFKVHQKGGKIIFHDPRTPLIRSGQDFQIFGDANDFNGNFHVKPKDDMIIFFPSWFEHSVQSSLSDEPRISIAFNIMSSYK
tara:strand:+ start:2254 stop:2814 length:561 start_codon:yes stop_codon:yes gene_type:complete